MNNWLNRVHFGDCLETLRRMPDGLVQTCITSPPYFGLRDYGHAGQIGLEDTPEQFIDRLVVVFREVRRVLRDDGTAWVNMGDSYCSTDKWGGGGNVGKQTVAADGSVPSWAVRQKRQHYEGIKPKDLIGIPWMLALALRADGWYLRQEVIWNKPNSMPEPVTDRCTKAHEHLFLLTKSPRYHFDAEAIAEPTRNKRSVWSVSTKPYKGAHFAVFPEDLIEPCILAGAPAGGVVLDPFMGSGTTAAVASRLGRKWVGCELNPEYEALQQERLTGQTPGLELA